MNSVVPKLSHLGDALPDGVVAEAGGLLRFL